MTHDENTALFGRRQQAWQRSTPPPWQQITRTTPPLRARWRAARRPAATRSSLYATYFAAFPDFKFEQEMLLIDGAERCPALVRVTGTDIGGFMGMAPTPQDHVPLRPLLTRFAAGIASERRVYDFTGLLIQVGLLKAKPV